MNTTIGNIVNSDIDNINGRCPLFNDPVNLFNSIWAATIAILYNRKWLARGLDSYNWLAIYNKENNGNNKCLNTLAICDIPVVKGRQRLVKLG